MSRRALASLSLSLLAFAAGGQGTICPTLTGDPLLVCLRANYARTTPIDYDLARDYLYGRNGQIGFYSAPYVGVYTGRSGPLGGGASPTQIDTEHTWPTSLMSNRSAQEGDMHNLFPTISKVNNDRGNLPFGDIDDAQTNGWYGPTGALPETTAPTANRDAFSERLTSIRFEPREDHKGNVARVLAYFYTLYGSASTSFWEQQRPYLVAWHRLDPPDSTEIRRNAFIRSKQGNDNPFILDTTLVPRAFSFAVATEPVGRPPAFTVMLAPSVTQSRTTLRATLPAPAHVTVTVFDALGRRVQIVPVGDVTGILAVPLDARDLPPGVYFVHVRAEGLATLAKTLTLVRSP